MFRTSFIFTALDSVNNPNDPHRNFFGQDRPDIALIGVRVNQQVFNQVASYTMAQPGHYTDFTIVGYGYTGVTDRDTDGNFIGYTMVRVPETSGTKRFANNTVSMRFVGNSPAGAPFRGAFVRWDLTIGAGAVAGEGVAFPGDSGGPYFGSALNQIDNIPVRTDAIMAVHHSGSEQYRNGSTGTGTELIAGYQQWIQAKCNLVPEPGSLLVLVSGSGWLLLLYRRRRVNA